MNQRLSILPNFLLGIFLQTLSMGRSYSQDLSILSDFGTSDIVFNGSMIVQNGSSNTAEMKQSVDAGGTGHYAEINQDGFENQAFIDQSGDLNRARINQWGSTNIANVTQAGIENFLDVSQTAAGNTFYSTQIGNHNSIVFSQPGAATANLVEIGNNNTINAVQGLGGTMNIRLEGYNLSDTVRQY
jgi:minor curlin subunit